MNTGAKDCNKILNELLEFVIEEKNHVRETGYHDDKVMGTAYETVQLQIESLMRDCNDADLESAKCNKHGVNHRVCANCYHSHHNHFESDYCGLNGNIIKNIYDHTCNVFTTKIEWLRKHGG